MAVPPPDLDVERRLIAEGARTVAGLDEVGRGAWAGPVSVGAVLWTPECAEPPSGVKDSKLLSPARRTTLAPLIKEWAAAWSIGSAAPSMAAWPAMISRARSSFHGSKTAIRSSHEGHNL